MPLKIDIGNVIALTGEAKISSSKNWGNALYRELNTKTSTLKIRLIPYFAWANRGKSDMTVWMPLLR